MVLIGFRKECSVQIQRLHLGENDPKMEDRISIYHDLLSKCYEQLMDNHSA